MSSSLDRLPEGTIERALRDVTQDAAEFKSRQRTTGQSGQLGYSIESVNAWDLTETFPTTPPSTALYAEYKLTFTGDGTQKFPIVFPATDIRVNGVADSNRVKLGTNGRYIYSSGGNVVQMYDYDEPDPSNFENENQLSWFIGLEYMGAVTVRMKARGQGSTYGTWSIVRTA